MPNEAHEDQVPIRSGKTSSADNGRRIHRISTVLLGLLSVGAVLALLMPVEFDKTHGIFERETKHLKCGSVVFPREEMGATTYNIDCGTARTQRLGYVGLALAAAGLVTTLHLARQSIRRDHPARDSRIRSKGN